MKKRFSVKLTECATTKANEKQKRSYEVPTENTNPKEEQDPLPPKKKK